MQLDNLDQKVRIMFGDTLVAETDNALRLLEVGRKAYAPQYYIPVGDISAALSRTEKSTHCPLKGDASYFTIDDVSGADEIGWSYEQPFDFAAPLSGYIAFDLRHVSIAIEAADNR
ncbi:MAG: DUF427 domain-containing protein [Hyphomicrobiales bacterium]|nr:DUF427 domain-containing protein [Hyphomicrobiales bacterium]MCP4998533.1 DUF427 domain-containing protein [Hyphomicrobiales bacterium]